MKIIFTDTIGIGKEYYISPAIREIPVWYKKTESFIGNKFKIEDQFANETIKKCVPVFDAMTSGYIIKTYVDVYVSQNGGCPYYQWPSFNPIEFHRVDQAKDHPLCNNYPFPKWINPWSIKTKNGYSCLFVNPMHNDNNIFKIFPGVVDTDTFFAPVNLPFVLNNPKWEGMIPAGTPIAQVIPFKRDSFKMEFGNKKDLEKINEVDMRTRSLWTNSYKKLFWKRKKYE